MLTWNKLRIDPGNDAPGMDYRIENGCVESRMVDDEIDERGSSTEECWQRLTPQELSCLVTANPLVARWLSRRMGIRRVIRACNEPCDEQSPSESKGLPIPDRIAA